MNPMIGRRIWIVEGQGFKQGAGAGGSNRMTAHASRRTAVLTAVDWTNELLTERYGKAGATPRNWRFRAEVDDVWIEETVLNA